MRRFTATEKWEKSWFQDLPPHLKCLWYYLCDKADCAGVWDVNWKLASSFIGKAVSETDLSYFQGKLVMIRQGKLLIVGFVAFQYGTPSRECRAHIPIFKAIEKHGIPYTKAIHSLKEKETEEETETEDPNPIPRTTATSETIPESLRITGFPEILVQFEEHRRQIKKPLTPLARSKLLQSLATRPGEAVEALNMAIRRSWQGFEWGWFDKEKPGGNRALDKSRTVALTSSEMPHIFDPMKE